MLIPFVLLVPIAQALPRGHCLAGVPGTAVRES